MSIDTLNDFNLADPGFLGCPYPYYKKMREEGGVFQIPDSPYVMVTKDELVRAVLSDKEHFSSKIGTPSTPASEELQAQLDQIRAEGWERTPSLILGDQPEHTQQRRVITPYVTVRAARALKPTMEEVLADLLDSVAGQDVIDFNNSISIPFGVRVICRVLDTPEENWETVLRWTDADAAAYGVFLNDEERIQVERDVVEMQQYYVNKVHQLRAKPLESHVLSAIAHAKFPDPQTGEEVYFDDAVVAEMARQMQTGGNETTRKYFCDMMLMLADNPEEWAAFRADRSRGPKIIEETLRLATQLQSAMRIALPGATIDGKEIPEGSVVLPFLGSANRDESRFECPAEFRPERENAVNHLTFSHGIHTCPGNYIARVEAEVLLNMLADRWETIEAVNRDAIEYEPSFLIRSIKSLQLKVTPAQ